MFDRQCSVAVQREGLELTFVDIVWQRRKKMQLSVKGKADLFSTGTFFVQIKRHEHKKQNQIGFCRMSWQQKEQAKTIVLSACLNCTEHCCLAHNFRTVCSLTVFALTWGGRNQRYFSRVQKRPSIYLLLSSRAEPQDGCAPSTTISTCGFVQKKTKQNLWCPFRISRGSECQHS